MARHRSLPLRGSCVRVEATDADWRRIGPARLVRMLEQIVLIREFEERLLELKDQDLVHGPVHSSIGQEAVAVGAAAALRPDDLVSSTHRGHHHFLAKALSARAPAPRDAAAAPSAAALVVRRTMAEILGLAEGWCGGRGGSMHLADDASGILGTNAIVGGGIPLTVGAGWAEKLKGTDRVALAFFGEGALNQGSFHEAANLAAVWTCPVVFLVENNLYAVATRVDETVSVCPVAQRALGYGLPALQVDGMDPVAVWAAVAEAVGRARAGEGPSLIEAETYRFKHQAQSLPGSAYGYRTREEEQAWEARDPASGFPGELLRRGVLQAEDVARVRANARRIVAEAVDAFVERDGGGQRRVVPSAWPEPESVLVGVRGDGSEWEGTAFSEREDFAAWEERSYVDVISETLGRRMETDDRVVVLGEEVGKMKGGAFLATRGLFRRFPDRVFSTPISEAGFCGLALGAALRGLRPVVEIMYPDFTLVAADQVFNQIGKARHMYGGTRDIPVVLRTRIGIGNGYGGQHSMDPASLYALFPGWRILAPATPFDYIGLMNSAILSNDPVLVIEHQRLYARTGEAPAGDRDYRTAIGRARVDRSGGDLTVITYGSMLYEVRAAAEGAAAEGVDVEILDLRTIDSPGLDFAAVARSVRRTHRVLIVEEAPFLGSPGAQLTDRVQREVFDELDGPVNRVASLDVPLPVSRRLERAAIPCVADIREAIAATIDGRTWMKTPRDPDLGEAIR